MPPDRRGGLRPAQPHLRRPANRSHGIGHHDVQQREAALAFGMRVAVHDSGQNDPNPSSHHFAAHTGTAPLEASSSQVVGHRLSGAGDRKLIHALYLVAMVPVRRPSTGQAYYRRKLAEVKSSKEALRCLKAPAVGRGLLLLLADQHHARSWMTPTGAARVDLDGVRPGGARRLADGSSAVAICHPRGLLPRRD